MLYTSKSAPHQVELYLEMKKDCLYKVVLLLDSISGGNTVDAECGCQAGKAPHASCKHVGALCYALEEYSHIGKDDHEYLTCIDRLQEWNKPRKKRNRKLEREVIEIIRCDL